MDKFTDIELAEIVEQWGQVYVPEGQTDKDIKKMIFTEDDISGDFRKVPNPGSIYKSAYSTIDEVLQAFQVPFAPKGDISFLPIQYQLGQFKVDVTLSPDVFRRSWLGFLAQLNEVDRAKWPFIRWYIQEMLVKRMAQDFISKVAFYGWETTGFVTANPVVNAETYVRQFLAGAKTPANATMDGILTVLQKINLTGRANVINVGAWSSDPETYCTQVENFVKQIPHEIRDRLDNLYVSKDRHELYREGKRLKYNVNYGQVTDLDTVNEATNIKVKGTYAMKGSNKHWITVPENRVKPVAADMTNRFKVELNKRVVDIYNDWSYALVIDVPEFLFMCDNELEWTDAQLLEHYGIVA
jgi:putative sterol carrier protein